MKFLKMTTTGAPRGCKAGGGAARSAAVPRRRQYLKSRISLRSGGENEQFPAEKTQKEVRNSAIFVANLQPFPFLQEKSRNSGAGARS